MIYLSKNMKQTKFCLLNLNRLTEMFSFHIHQPAGTFQTERPVLSTEELEEHWSGIYAHIDQMMDTKTIGLFQDQTI